MTVTEYVRAVGRGWLLILILAVVGGIAGYAVAATTAPTYRSGGAMLVTSDRGTSAAELVQGNAYVQNLVATYVLLVKSEVVLQPVIDELGLETTPRSLANSISASSPINSVIIEIAATSGSPQLAQRIADATMRSLSDVVSREVAPTDTAGNPTVRLTTIESADAPRYPVTPVVRNLVGLGAGAGLAVGVLIALVRALVGRTVRDRSDIRTVTAVPVLGEVVEARRGSSLPAAVLTEPLGIEADSVRGVAANLNFLKVDGGLRSIVITSASPAESKSSLAIALGLMIAESSRRVLLIDADLRSPSVAAYTQLAGGVGLTNVLIGEVLLEDAVQEWGAGTLHVLTAGSEAPNPTQLLTSRRMTELVESVTAQYDFVIIDSAPLLALTDATWLGNLTDGAVLAVLHNKTTLHALEKVVSAAETGGLTLLGAVLTRVPRRGISRYGSGSYGGAGGPSQRHGR